MFICAALPVSVRDHRKSYRMQNGQRSALGNAESRHISIPAGYARSLADSLTILGQHRRHRLGAEVYSVSMAVPSTNSSLLSSHDFSVSRVASNGNTGVISSVIWLAIAAGLCFPWLLEKPSASKADDAAKSVAWFVILALDLIIGTTSVFSLWFQKSTLSIMLLIWGACAIVATYLLGSFAMLPAVATM